MVAFTIPLPMLHRVAQIISQLHPSWQGNVITIFIIIHITEWQNQKPAHHSLSATGCLNSFLKIWDLLESKMSPGSKAAVALTNPLPMSNAVAGDWFTSGLE